MVDETVKILEHQLVARDTYRMVLQGQMSEAFRPGQFVNVKIEGYTLRRPISVSRFDPEQKTFVLLYKVLGEGTQKMAQMKTGDELTVLGPLGNGFPIETGDSALLIGGGAGVGPLVQVAKELCETMKKVTVVLGFPTKEEIYATEELQEMGISVKVCTDDGSFGFKGNGLELIEAEKLDAEFVYACGPKAMLRAIDERFTNGYLSLDVRMACGMGACMACVCKDQQNIEKYYRVCKEGPVFPLGKVVIE